MRAGDLIIQTKESLEDKKTFWEDKDEVLLIKLQESYMTLQFDLPCFMAKETLAIQKDKSEYYLDNTPIQNIILKIDGVPCDYSELENFYIIDKPRQYTFSSNKLLIGDDLLKVCDGFLVYHYQKKLTTLNCEIETPAIYDKALRLLFKNSIYEKPTPNVRERNVSSHYLTLYQKEVLKLKREKKLRVRRSQSQYKRI